MTGHGEEVSESCLWNDSQLHAKFFLSKHMYTQEVASAVAEQFQRH